MNQLFSYSVIQLFNYSVIRSMRKFFLLSLFYIFAIKAVLAQNGTAGTLNWNINSGELVITGNGAIPDYDTNASNFAPWYAYRYSITGIIIDEGVTAIGAHSFAFLDQINAVAIPTTVTSIARCAFMGASLISVVIPASVNNIHHQFVHECFRLTEILVDPANKHYTSHEGVLLNKSKTTVIACPAGKEGKYTIPVTITCIGSTAFHFGLLSYISIPSSVISIETNAFSFSRSLIEIINHSVIPQTIEELVFETTSLDVCTLRVPAASIESYQNAEIWKQFGNIKPLADFMTGSIWGISWKLDENGVLTLNGAVNIPDKFFESLAPKNSDIRNNTYSIVIEEGITGIGNAAFFGSEQITSVSIPNTVTMIDVSAFAYCTNLTSITIPASVNNIQRFFLAGCTSLTSIIVEEGNNDFVSVDGVLFNKDMTWLAAFPAGKPGNFSYDIPNSVVYVGDDAFYECAGLTAVTIPASAKSIGSCAFYACSSLTSVKIPFGVTHIYMRAFECCVNLTSAVIPASISFMDFSVFGNCIRLTEVVSAVKQPISISGDVFWGIDLNLCKLMVPFGSIEDYSSAFVWLDFGEITMLDAGLKLNKTEICLLSGAISDISATINIGLDPAEVEWYSSHLGIASVDNTGTVLAIKPGSVDIYALAYGCTAFCMVTVLQPGNSTIAGTVDNAGTGNVRVNLYIKVGETGKKGEAGETKKGIIGGYVLLATVIPNDNGEYCFEDLPEGLYQIDVEIDEYESEASKVILLSEGETRTDVNFVLDEETGTVAPKIVTGMVETGRAPSLQIYPNPFTDVVQITVETGHAPSLRMQVINTAGAIVHTQTIASPEETIHLGHLPAGLYIIRIENGKIVKTLKTIKIP